MSSPAPPAHPLARSGDRLGDLLRHWRRARRTGFFCAGMSRMDPPPFAFQLDRRVEVGGGGHRGLARSGGAGAVRAAWLAGRLRAGLKICGLACTAPIRRQRSPPTASLRTRAPRSWQGITDDPAAAHRSDAERGARGAPLVRATPRPMGAWWAEHVAGPMPRAMCTNAVLAVHRDRVRLRPRSFYATLLKQFSAGPNLEASHYMERGWAALLYAPEALAGCQRG